MTHEQRYQRMAIVEFIHEVNGDSSWFAVPQGRQVLVDYERRVVVLLNLDEPWPALSIVPFENVSNMKPLAENVDGS